MMKLLLTVEDAFQVTGRGLVLAPDIDPAWRSSNFKGFVTIAPPAADAFEAAAELAWAHFRPGGMKMLLSLPGEPKESVPVGSLIYIDSSDSNESS